jgi:hypothetical protein
LAAYREVMSVSIVRIGLAETKKFAEGYDAIFGKRTSGEAGPSQPAKAPAAKKKKEKKRKK